MRVCVPFPLPSEIERTNLLPEMLALNIAAVSIVAECTKAVSIDFHTDLVGTCVSGMENITKGKRAEFERRKDGIMHILLTSFLKRARHFIGFFMTTFGVLRKYTLLVLFVP